MAGRVLPVVTLGVLLVAITFGVMALNFQWAKVDQSGEDGGFAPLSMRQTLGGDADLRVAYTAEGFDDVDGIGMIRAAGPLWLIGIIVLGLAALTAEHRLLLGRNWLDVATLAATGIGAILVTVGLVLLPIGIAEFAKSPALGGAVDIKWVFGLYAGIVAAAGALAATVLTAITVLRSTGFKLELAAGAAADFDG